MKNSPKLCCFQLSLECNWCSRPFGNQSYNFASNHKCPPRNLWSFADHLQLDRLLDETERHRLFVFHSKCRRRPCSLKLRTFVNLHPIRWCCRRAWATHLDAHLIYCSRQKNVRLIQRQILNMFVIIERVFFVWLYGREVAQYIKNYVRISRCSRATNVCWFKRLVSDSSVWLHIGLFL